jgi:cytochrome c2
MPVPVRNAAAARRTAVVSALCGALVLCALASACGEASKASMDQAVTTGDPKRGARTIEEFGCGACHTIPGIRGARGVVGPPLFFMARRTYIAGHVPNTPANMSRWIRNPKEIEPRTAMPVLGLSEQQANDVVAYLYTLR